VDGETCSYGDGCDSEQCSCSNGYWECIGVSCPPPSCPAAPPGNTDACSEIGSLCDYPIDNNVCSTWECDCYPDGIWSCYETNCGGFDGGSGSSSGGFADAGSFGQ
jgi:hypothetical protein